MAGDRAPPPRASPRAPCRDGRVKRPSTKIGWPSDAIAGSTLSFSVRDCENDARWCPRRASRRSYGCRGSCSRPWWWSGVTRAALVGDVGVGVARLRRQVSSSAMGLFGIGVGGLVCPNTLGQKKLSDKKHLPPLATKMRSTY